MSIVLCYNKETDHLYTSPCKKDTVLFESYENKGYNHDKSEFLIPDTKFSIEIKTNFEYRRASYLRAFIKYNDVPLLNFHNWHNCIDRKLTTFDVEPTPQHWETLFNQIIEVYNHKDSWNHDGALLALDNLDNALSHPEETRINHHPWLPPQNTNDEPSHILHLARKSLELSQGLKTLKLDDTQPFKNRLNAITEKLILLIIKEYKHLLQEKQIGIALQQHITTNLSELEQHFTTIYTCLKRKKQLNLLFQNLL